VSTAIDKYVFAFAKWRTDDRVIIHWREKEDVGHAGELNHDLIREILLSEGIQYGIEIATFADVPGVGSGLGSSAATTCACYAAVMALKGYRLDPLTIASAAVYVEIGRLLRHCGSQDQYASAFGGFLDLDHNEGLVAERRALERNATRDRRIPEFLALFSSGGRSAESILSERNPGSEMAWRGDCVELCKLFVEALNTCNYEVMGHLVGQHHKLKAERFPGYINSEIRSKLDATKLPYKICGAGGAGHLLVATTPETRATDIEKIEAIWGPELPWMPVAHGTEIIHAE
jgi:D-glycero-alpha-D-manno-heptose-7-phosphate kinase